MALRSDGVPLGLLGQHYWSRPVEPTALPPDPKRPIKEKESYKWLRGIEAAEAALESLPESERPRLIHVMDREGDIHEVLERITDSPHGAVIRSVQNRSVDGSINKSIEAVRAAPLLGIHRLDVPAKHGQPRRKARCELRSVTLTITPNLKKHPDRKPLTWTLVETREVDAPAGVEPLCWLLWTTEPAGSRAQIIGVLNIYKLRWHIEDFHLTLKSGCRAEALELETADRLIKALMLYSMIAVRIVALRDLARQEPDAPCTTILSTDAWHALFAKFEKKTPGPDTPVPTVRQAILWIGRLGGHLNRKRDGMPGVRTLWRGWRDLTILVAGYRLGRTLRRFRFSLASSRYLYESTRLSETPTAICATLLSLKCPPPVPRMFPPKNRSPTVAFSTKIDATLQQHTHHTTGRLYLWAIVSRKPGGG